MSPDNKFYSVDRHGKLHIADYTHFTCEVDEETVRTSLFTLGYRLASTEELASHGVFPDRNYDISRIKTLLRESRRPKRR